MGIGFKELLVILVIVLVLFGAKRLKTIGTDLGSAIKGFRKSMQEGEEGADTETGDKKAESVEDQRIIEGEVAAREKHKA